MFGCLLLGENELTHVTKPNFRTTEADFSSYAALDSAVVVIGNHGKIAYANDASSKLWGYSNKELVGQNVKLLMVCDPFVLPTVKNQCFLIHLTFLCSIKNAL